MPAILRSIGLLMRRFISLRFLSLWLFSLVVMNASSQNVDKNGFNYLRMNEVNSHAARHFLTNFSEANLVGWIKEPDLYVVRFTVGYSTAKAYYDDNGNFICCLKHCLSEELSSNLKSAIFNQFPECKILIVNELTNLEKQAYFINIKCGEYIKTLCCNDEGIKVTENFKDAGL
jgi:hypothetical protein